MPRTKQDRALVSKDEVPYLLRKWSITRKELLEIKGKKRSRKAIEKLLREAGYKTKRELIELKDQKFKTIPARKNIPDNR
jgi:hypothetical protein